ncbi:nucleotide sugar dehydrogenase [Campylobacter sp. LR185c]|uniref:nucleotide sugar dehydrogenase n=1 Tax=Campylobacter sp. LR185c TaxID=2014525 RepID=UPI001237A12E|nr:nucleotide sugar dehydrogenase [Campylobacter sp. LR185c]KAA6224794.1 nucleotide sugar dehydrogenase [Campylobacter sp. LR185c]KAA8604885.1 UDP-glucose 6-dehydrogenase [Campylobacter sp. LR185c]
MKITIVGTGYVGLSNALLLAQQNEVIALDIDEKKVSLLNAKKSPIDDKEIKEFLSLKALNFKATLDKEEAYKNSDFIIIATPTDYNTQSKFFDTSSIESVINNIIKLNKNASIIIKSTIPIGYTKNLKDKFKDLTLCFSPEFLREGKALYDNLYPSRIVIGYSDEKSKKSGEIFANLLKNAAYKKEIQILFMKSDEAEAVKLFANTYLAMRVAYFNEIDSFALSKNLNASDIIKGICLDDRIGMHYNNPSFGYGGYCLPKDTKQLLQNYEDIPNSLIKAIVQANDIRKHYIVKLILEKKPKVIGIYRLVMKMNSDNFRQSAIIDIMNLLKEKTKLIIYEPLLKDSDFMGIKIINDLNEFKEKSELILANRKCDELLDIEEKVFSRDIFLQN